MRRLVTVMALLTSLLAFVIVVGTGLFLAGVEQSGERLAGAVMAAGGVIAAAAVLLLALARPEFFRRRRLLAIGAAIVGMTPVAGLATALLVFAGLPLDSAIPRLDWPLFAAGIVFALGAVSILALGYRRAAGAAPPPEPQVPEMPLDATPAAETARRAIEIDRNSVEIDENVRVRRA